MIHYDYISSLCKDTDHYILGSDLFFCIRKCLISCIKETCSVASASIWILSFNKTFDQCDKSAYCV